MGKNLTNTEQPFEAESSRGNQPEAASNKAIKGELVLRPAILNTDQKMSGWQEKRGQQKICGGTVLGFRFHFEKKKSDVGNWNFFLPFIFLPDFVKLRIAALRYCAK